MSRTASPGWGGLREYLAERFPVVITLLLSMAVAVAATAAAQGETLRSGIPFLLDGTALAGGVMAFLFVFLLRVFDEHKDFAHDALTRPDRPVQRGLITLAQLRILGAIAVALQLVLAFLPGVSVGLTYLIPLAYSVLMYFEFFVPEWLSKRMFLYALTHTLVMCLIALALAWRFTFRSHIGTPIEVWLLLAMCMSSFFSIDVLRKIWAPENEVEGVDSYSRTLGYHKSAILGASLLVGSAAAAAVVGWRLGGRLGWLATLAAVTGWALFEIFRFAGTPTAKREKMLQVVAGVHLLVLFFGLGVVSAVAHGAVVGIGNWYTSIGLGS